MTHHFATQLSRGVMTALGLVLLTSPAHAQTEAAVPAGPTSSILPDWCTVSGYVSVASDYVSRGITQTNHNPTVQGYGALNMRLGDSGVDAYISGFASNVDYVGTDAKIELDYYAGLHGVHGAFDWDLSFDYYDYAGQSTTLNLDYYEYIAKIGYTHDWFRIAAQVNYTPQFGARAGTAFYKSLRLEQYLPQDITLFEVISHQSIQDNVKAGTPDYADYQIGITKSIWDNVSAGLTYSDTNMSKSECYGGTTGDLCSGRFVVNLTYSF